MAYSDNLDDEGINSQYLAIIKPRRLMDTATWSLVSATVYKQSFDYGQILNVTDDGTTLDEASSSALSDGDWFYDTDNLELYIDVGGDPSTSDIVATYEIYVGTYDAHFNRIPDDDTTRNVYYEPVIVRSPTVRSSSSQVLFGFLPTQSTQIVLSNATHIFEKHVYDSSFNRADIDIYHYLGELITENVKKIFSGSCTNVLYNDQQLTIPILDRNNIFNEEYRNSVGTSFYTTGQFSGLDPDFEIRPIRQVYGVVDGFIPVNIDFVKDSPTTSDNREWSCIQEESGNLPDKTATVQGGSTTTRTYVDDADGLSVGDHVFIDSSGGPAFDEYPIITLVDKSGSPHFFEHAATANAAASGSIVYRPFVGALTLVQTGGSFDLAYNRDFTTYFDGTNKIAGFQLTASAESNVGATTINPTTDYLHARIYGTSNNVTLGGPAFGSDSSDTNNLTSGIVILFDLLKKSGLAESDIDTTTFTSLEATITDQVGFAIPTLSTENFPTYKELLIDILQTLLLKFFLDNDNKWTISQVAPLGTVTKTIEDDEILQGSFKYEFNYSNIVNKIINEYRFREVSKKNTRSNSADRVTSASTNAERLHLVIKQKTYKSLHILESEAQTYSDRLSYIFGERTGSVEFLTKNRFFDTELNDNIKISRTRMPGYDYDVDTNRDRESSVIASNKSLRTINISADDQKGIEDNSGSW